VVLLLLPDEVLADVVAAEIAPDLAPGAALGVAHGSVLAFGVLDPPAGHDVFLVAPTGPGIALRERYVAGEGIPAVVAVHRDVTGSARRRALAVATALGCDRAGVFESTVEEEAVVDLFGEQAVLCGGLAELVVAGYETLVEAGYAPEMAYLECVHQIQLTASLVTRYGVDGMWGTISRTAAFGALESGPRIVGAEARRAMRERLTEIAGGDFFRRFVDDHRAGGGGLASRRDTARRADMEAVGRTLRARMGGSR
jgi:ketol-acid reductoisomerase